MGHTKPDEFGCWTRDAPVPASVFGIKVHVKAKSNRPGVDSFRVLRGGSDYHSSNARSANRDRAHAEALQDNYGFRLVRELD